jgi:hypothetical protein
MTFFIDFFSCWTVFDSLHPHFSLMAMTKTLKSPIKKQNHYNTLKINAELQLEANKCKTIVLPN